MKDEKWKDVYGYEGLYKINTKGVIKSTRRDVVMTPRIINRSCMVFLTDKNGGKRFRSVNTLVAKAFIKNKLKRKYVLHKDGNLLNNKTSNLKMSNRYTKTVIGKSYVCALSCGLSPWEK